MSYIDKLAIKGIRSFDSKPTNDPDHEEPY